MMVALFLGAAPSLSSRPLRVAFVGDPQADGLQQLDYCRKTIYKELRERKDLDLVIVLGDLVNDDVSLLAPSKASLDSLPCPWLCVPGNHDRDVYPKSADGKRPRDIRTYRKVIGYEDTTFFRGGVRFILMNDVRPGGKGYEGGFRNSQKVWLDSVLRATPEKTLAVLAAHIPFTEFSSRDSLSSLLAAHPNLLLVCGHTHRVGRGTFTVAGLNGRSVEVPEVQVGATCGMFWLGTKGEDGFPDATMVCGAPRGYFVADLRRNGKYSLAYKAVLRRDVASAWIQGDSSLVVNVYGGEPGGDVEVKVPGVRGWLKAAREMRPAPEALAVIERNKSIPRRIGKSRNPEYSPMRKVNSPHVWAVRSDALSDASAADSVRIRYRDSVMRLDVKAKLSRQ